MSEELRKLESRAALKCITDHEHIDRIIRYMLSLPFSYFRQDERRYKYLQNDLCNGFSIYQNSLDRMSLEDILILIGYEPGTPYFNPPDREKRRFSKKFNAAGHSYVLALMLNSLSEKDIRIKEFTHIGISAYTDYLKKIVEDEYRNNLILFSARSDRLREVEAFKRKAYGYVKNVIAKAHIESTLGNVVTLGDLISKALVKCGMSWMCTVRSLDAYSAEIMESYDLLNSLFMDAIRMPLIRADRERFQEIITKYCDSRFHAPVNIDYETCYEHGGIIKQ